MSKIDLNYVLKNLDDKNLYANTPVKTAQELLDNIKKEIEEGEKQLKNINGNINPVIGVNELHALIDKSFISAKVELNIRKAFVIALSKSDLTSNTDHITAFEIYNKLRGKENIVDFSNDEKELLKKSIYNINKMEMDNEGKTLLIAILSDRFITVNEKIQNP